VLHLERLVESVGTDLILDARALGALATPSRAVAGVRLQPSHPPGPALGFQLCDVHPVEGNHPRQNRYENRDANESLRECGPSDVSKQWEDWVGHQGTSGQILR